MTPATYHPTHSRTLPPPDQGSEDNLFLVISDYSEIFSCLFKFKM